MTATTVLLDPTSGPAGALRARRPPPRSLAGLTIGLLDISKPRGDVFLGHVSARLQQRGLTVESFVKPTYARPAPGDLLARLAERCDVVVEALAD